MRNLMRWARTNSRDGFTLVETVVVVTIIGILALIAVNLLGSTRDANTNTEVKSALEEASLVMKQWPSSSSNESPGDWSELAKGNNYLKLSPNTQLSWQVEGEGYKGTSCFPAGAQQKTVYICLNKGLESEKYGGGTSSSSRIEDGGVTFISPGKEGKYFCVGENNHEVTTESGVKVPAYQLASQETLGKESEKASCEELSGTGKWDDPSWLGSGKAG